MSDYTPVVGDIFVATMHLRRPSGMDAVSLPDPYLAVHEDMTSPTWEGDAVHIASKDRVNFYDYAKTWNVRLTYTPVWQKSLTE